MTLQFDVATVNTLLDGLETSIGVNPILRIRSGALPANCAAADAGVMLAEMTMPADWMAAAAAGTKVKAGVWPVVAAAATGIAAHFRVYESTGTTCKHQGEATDTVGAGPLKLSSTSITAGQNVEITAFTWTGPV